MCLHQHQSLWMANDHRKVAPICTTSHLAQSTIFIVFESDVREMDEKEDEIKYTESVNGLKDKRPANTIAVTSSGEATNACVFGLASLRPVKLRLYEVMMEFLAFLGTS